MKNSISTIAEVNSNESSFDKKHQTNRNNSLNENQNNAKPKDRIAPQLAQVDEEPSGLVTANLSKAAKI